MFAELEAFQSDEMWTSREMKARAGWLLLNYCFRYHAGVAMTTEWSIGKFHKQQQTKTDRIVNRQSKRFNYVIVVMFQMLLVFICFPRFAYFNQRQNNKPKQRMKWSKWRIPRSAVSRMIIGNCLSQKCAFCRFPHMSCCRVLYSRKQ